MNKKLLNKCFALLLTISMVAHFVGSNFYFHTHIIDGEEISHSHPYYPSNGGASHSHSTLEFNTINLLSNLTYLAVTVFAVLFISVNSKALFNVVTTLMPKFGILAHKQLRAPPFL